MSEKKTISITRALREVNVIEATLKQYGDRNIPWSGVTVGKEMVGCGLSEEDLIKAVQTNKDSIINLTSRRHAIKRAITFVNATTEITVAGKTMFICEAIDRRTFYREHLEVLKQISANIVGARTFAEREKVKLETVREKRIADFVASQTVTAELLASMNDEFNATHQIKEIYPHNVKEWIEKELEFIMEFVSDVDYALSEVNAKTELTV